jgi:hypothetical protein
MVPIILYSDDTSGNRGKKWNKHDTWYLRLAGLPFNLSQQHYHIHFLATSNICNSMEMARGIIDALASEGGLFEGISTYDAVSREDVLVIGGVLCALGDNPMQSDMTSHIGMSGRRFCRRCNVGWEWSIDGMRRYIDVR